MGTLKNERPVIKPEAGLLDKIFELLARLTLISLWVFTIFKFADLPDQIPTHYNAAGQADGYGKKVMILMLPAIASVLFVVLTILNRFPHVFNYPVTITNENALREYTRATRLIRYFKTITVCIFGLIAFQTVRHAGHKATGLGIWMLPLILGLIFVPLIFYIFHSFKFKRIH